MDQTMAAEALGNIGTPAIDSLLVALKDSDDNLRGLAAEALAKIKDPRAVNALLESLKNHDSAAISGAFEFFIARGEPGSEEALIEALNNTNNRTMAGYFLISKNTKLEEAAKAWAKIGCHDPATESGPPSLFPTWGSVQETQPPSTKK
jgi:HEAT repeat protein